MKRSWDAWIRHPWLWALPLAFCLVNLLAYAVYEQRLAGGVEGLEARYQQKAERLEGYKAEEQQLEEILSRVDEQQTHFVSLYEDHFQGEDERFTMAINTVKRLARDAGLNPTSFSYPRVPLGTTGLVSRGIHFGVEGTYRELRTFINFLELSEQFLVLDGISLSQASGSGSDPRLSIGLKASTIFVETNRLEEDPES
jgi:hypothetical protein